MPAPYNGIHKIYKFANGYGASVVCHDGSYGGKSGLWELAVLDKDGKLSYDTPVTNDVIGWLDEDAVEELLAKIEALDSDPEVNAKADLWEVGFHEKMEQAMADLWDVTNHLLSVAERKSAIMNLVDAVIEGMKE